MARLFIVKKKKKKNSLNYLEKVSLLYGKGFWHIRGAPSLGLEDVEVHDGPMGLRKCNEPNYLKEGSQVETVKSTCFPSPALLACSFDPNMAYLVGEAIGNEARANNTKLILGPGINIKRNPLGGRNFEYFSEDPLISGKMGAAYIRGVQSTSIGACLKHFAVNNQESHRFVSDSIIDKRALHEIYLKGFEIAIKEGNPWAVMSSYNLINGEHACESDFLNNLLRKQWGYEGIHISDWGGTIHPISSHNHGLDIEMPCTRKRKRMLYHALKKGTLSKEAVNHSSSRIVAFLRKAHGAQLLTFAPIEQSRKVAQEAILSSAILLKNEGVLPLKKNEKVCFIGELARTPHYQGGGSSKVEPIHLSTFYEVMKLKYGEEFKFTPGYSLDNSDDNPLRIDAVDLASKADVAVVFIGTTQLAELEGVDKKTLAIPENQQTLLSELVTVCPKVIAIIQSGGPIRIPEKDKLKGIMAIYLTGQEAGEPLRQLLYGEVSPSGKLAESWPEHAIDIPSFGFYPGEGRTALYRESIYVGYRYYLTAKKKVAFPFGHGLSYAKFSYGDLKLSRKTIPGLEGKVTASIEVSNHSDFPAQETIELYASRSEKDKGEVFRPTRWLIGFKKMAIPAKGKVTFKIDFDGSELAHYDIDQKGMLVEDGKYLIQAGLSCETIISSVELESLSMTICNSHRSKYPIYYSLSGEGFLRHDVPFENLLGHAVGMRKDPALRPYNRDSTLEDISDSWVGGKIIKTLKKKFPNPETNIEDAVNFKSAMQMPLRSLVMAGISERLIAVIVDLANAKPFKAIGHLLFGSKKGL